jgi:hypothetical protein
VSISIYFSSFSLFHFSLDDVTGQNPRRILVRTHWISRSPQRGRRYESWAWTCLQYRPKLWTEPIKLCWSTSPCRYRVAFDAPRASPDSLALTFRTLDFILLLPGLWSTMFPEQ